MLPCFLAPRPGLCTSCRVWTTGSWSWFRSSTVWHISWSNHTRSNLQIWHSDHLESRKWLWWREIYVLEIVITALLDTKKSSHNTAKCYSPTLPLDKQNNLQTEEKNKDAFSPFVWVRQIGRMRTKTSVLRGALSHLIPTHRSYKGSPVHSVKTLLACLCW